MRKQDRIANQQRRDPQDERNQSQPQEDRERMRGGNSERMRGIDSEATRPQRQSGKLPLPD
jgi:hypothetical protein